MIAWVTGETIEGLISGLALVAVEVGVGDPDGDDLKSAVAARGYLTALSEPSLLVVDNAEHPEEIAPWLPTGRCRVVITSTDRRFTDLGEEVPLGGYTREQSIAYLGERTRLSDPDGAHRVGEELGDLPLALAQAVAVIRSRHLTYADYLDQLAATTLGTYLSSTGAYARGLAKTQSRNVTRVTRPAERAPRADQPRAHAGAWSAPRSSPPPTTASWGHTTAWAQAPARG